jgi:putative ABC transport system permease protein
MTDLVRASLLDRELELGLLGIFALVAVALAAAGIYGVMSYTIAQRHQEFGIRLALGASSKDIVHLVGAEGARLTAAGTSIGLAGALGGGRVLQGLLYGVEATNANVLVAAAALLIVVAAAACVVPTVRALRADPLTSLRAQ